MTVLYVDRKGVGLRVDGNTLVFEEAGSRLACVPLGPLERVVLRGDVTLQASVLGKLGQCGVGVMVLSGRKAEPTLLMPRPHNDARRRVNQWKQAQDDAFRLSISRDLVRRKVEAQITFLTERGQADLMHRYELRVAVRRMEAAVRDIDLVTTLGKLRGMEGAAAQAYFGGYKVLFAESLHFSGRNRRPPRDPVNAVLSLSYTLLHAEAVLQVYAAGLDPYVGFFHELDFGRESLACDLVEPHRVAVDRWVLRLFRDRVLTPDHFSTVQGSCLLGKAGRERFYRAWEGCAESLRQALRVSCSWLVRSIEGGDGEPADSAAPGTPDRGEGGVDAA